MKVQNLVVKIYCVACIEELSAIVNQIVANLKNIVDKCVDLYYRFLQ